MWDGKGVESERGGTLLDLTNPKMVVGLSENLVVLSPVTSECNLFVDSA